MSRRTVLVSVSIVGHLAIGFGLFASGIWKLEKLDSDYRLAGIGVMVPPVAAGGSPEALPEAKFVKKPPQDKRIAKNVQWDKRVEPNDPKPAATTGEPGNGLGTGTGESIGPGDGDTDGATCALPPCGGGLPPLPEPPAAPPPPTPKPVPPQVMAALRISGETQIHPAAGVKSQIIHDRRSRVIGTLKVCIQASGAIGSVTVLSSTKYPEYDRQLADAARRWRYRPYVVDGVPTPACSAVSFVYSIK